VNRKAKRRGSRSTKMVYPGVGPNPFRELREGMDDEGVGSRTYAVTAMVLSHYLLFLPGGGHIPHTKIARLLGLNHEDVKAIVEVWAGVIFNHLVRKTGDGKVEATLPSPSSSWASAQSDLEGEDNSCAFSVIDATASSAQLGGLYTSCSSAQKVEWNGLTDSVGAYLNHSEIPAQSPALSTSYIIKRNDSLGDLAERFRTVFVGNRSWLCANKPDGDHRIWQLPKGCEGRDLQNALEDHFEGSQRLSIFPISGDPSSYQEVRFAAIDLDGEDRLQDAARLLDRLEALGVVAYLEKSFSDGYHIWIFFSGWNHAGNVRRFLERLLAEEHTHAEIRPSTNEFGGGDGPRQKAIALPYFGDGGPNGDQCRILDRDTLRPIPIENFLNHIEFNDRVPLLPVPSRNEYHTKVLHLNAVPSLTSIAQLVASWPAVSQGEYHLSASGKPKGGRDEAALAHAGELAAREIFGAEALRHLSQWNSTNAPPLTEKALLAKVRYVAKKNGIAL
jgi:hypothetical protein